VRARQAILELSLEAAQRILADARDDPAVVLERARLALYRGDCDGAVALLDRPDLEELSRGAELYAVASGCARTTAATIIVSDEKLGVVVRLQDDEDAVLVYRVLDTAAATRAMLAEDLGVRLPDPLIIDVVRDQFSLAAMTGLPEEAAQTTGTVGIAKWGRVILVSPRAAPHGYPWLDTLAHEITHLAVSRATRDRAPLWLQEGVAKRQERRWRPPGPLDEIVNPDVLAALGMDRGLGLPLTELGPSIAMLPSPEQARVVFAQVTSFVRYWAEQAGADALPELLTRIRDTPGAASVSEAMREVSGAGLEQWDARWRAHLRSVPRTLPPNLAPGEDLPQAAEIARRARLGALLQRRGHFLAAATELDRAHQLLPSAPRLRAELAASLLGAGDRANAAMLVADPTELDDASARWWSLHDVLHRDRHPLARWRAIALDPLSPEVACAELPPPELPDDRLHAALCAAARRMPR